MAIYRGPGGPGDATGDAANAAQIASQFADAAALSASQAAASASAANTDAGAAEAAKIAALAAQTAAELAETNAETAETNAETAETNAETAASAASTSATNASNSASAASTSATNAANSASAAATSATNASNSASSASTSATNASNSASSAATSASNAATSATNAAASEDLAEKWATEAEDVQVTTGKYSALHWAAKAEDSATAFTTSPAYSITSTQVSNWDTAYGWGNHASAGYLTSITGQSIKNLSDVSDSMTPSDGQILTWDSTGGVWQAENAPVSLPDQTGNAGEFLTTDGTTASWAPIATGNTTAKGMWQHSNTINENITIETNYNALSAGPITVASGYTVTVPSGSVWTIV